MTQDGSLSFESPSSFDIGNKQESALVEKDEMSRKSFSLFLYAASDNVSSGLFSFRLFVMPGVLVFDN